MTIVEIVILAALATIFIFLAAAVIHGIWRG